MRISRLFVGVAAAILLGGCGDDGRPSPPPSPPAGAAPKAGSSAAADVDTAAVFLQLAQCFRAHGHPDFPDPVQGADGSWGFPVTADRVAAPKECADLVKSASQLSPYALKSPAAADAGQGRAFAQCMRDNGIPDWPDPNPDGTFTIPARMSDPSAEHQWKPTATGPCKRFLSDDGPEIVMGAPR